jgi:hypothetical protein
VWEARGAGWQTSALDLLSRFTAITTLARIRDARAAGPACRRFCVSETRVRDQRLTVAAVHAFLDDTRVLIG